jgi:hypothetical protein
MFFPGSGYAAMDARAGAHSLPRTIDARFSRTSQSRAGQEIVECFRSAKDDKTAHHRQTTMLGAEFVMWYYERVIDMFL